MCTLGNQGKAFNQKFPKINVNDNILKRFNNNETAGNLRRRIMRCLAKNILFKLLLLEFKG